MLTCRDVELLLQDYLDGYLLPSLREVLEEHVRRCPSCAGLLAGLHRIDDRLDGFEPVEVPEGLAPSVLARLPADAYRPAPLRRALAWGAAPALALLLLLSFALLPGRYRLQGIGGTRVVEVVLSAPQATSVAVVGDFNSWDAKRNTLVRQGREGTWRARLRLSPGVYQYSFIVDGREWVADPAASGFVPDGFGGRNSVMVVDG